MVSTRLMVNTKSEESIKKINMFAYSAIAVVFIVMFIMPCAFADFKCDIINGMIKQITEGVTKVYYDFLTPSGAKSSILNMVISESPGGLIGHAYNIAAVAGGFLCIIYGYMHMLTDESRGMDHKEALTKAIKQLFLVAIFLMLLPTVLNTLAKIGFYFIEGIASYTIDSEAPTTLSLAMLDANADASGFMAFFSFIGCFLTLAIPYLASWVMTAAAHFIVFSLLIEIAIRRVFAPVAMANVYGEGLRSPGMRYMMRYVACFLKIAIALFVAMLNPMLLSAIAATPGSDVGGIMGYLVCVVACNFTVLGMSQKLGEYANDIAGV